MSRQKIKVQTVIGPPRIVSLDPDATVGAQLGTDLKGPDGAVLTVDALLAWLGLSQGVAGAGTTNHSALQNLSANDHPQYALAAALAAVAFSGDYADLTGTPAAGGYDPIKNFRFFDHLIGELSSSTFSTDWTYAVGGTSSTFSPNAAMADHPGVWRLTHGTTASAFSRVFHYGDTTATARKMVASANKITLEFAVSFQTAPTAANSYDGAVGARASFASALSLIAGSLVWDTGSSSIRWKLTTRTEAGATTATVASSAFTFTAGQYYRVKLEINTTTASLYVDGVLQAQHSTNLPDGGMALYAQMLQVAGAATRYMDVDWVDWQQDLSGVWP